MYNTTSEKGVSITQTVEEGVSMIQTLQEVNVQEKKGLNLSECDTTNTKKHPVKEGVSMSQTVKEGVLMSQARGEFQCQKQLRREF